MYLLFRLISLIALLSLVVGIILKVGHFGHWFDSSVFFSIGIIGSLIAYSGKSYWDYRKKTKNSN
jgi:hypothetical protein